MPLTQVRIGPPSNINFSDGDTVDVLGGKSGEMMVSELHGKYLTQTYRGNLWSFSITTATAIPVFATNATPNFFIFNPPGNTTAVVPVRFNVGFHGGTGIAGAIGYSYITNVPSLVGTAAPVSAATLVSPKSGIVGQSYTGNIITGSAATISGTAPYALTQLRWSNMSQGAPITSTATAYSLFEEFDGNMIIPPGTLWCPTASTAIAETLEMSLIAYEIPLP